MPMRRWLAGRAVTSRPPTTTVPESGVMKPAMIRSSVVFPHPLGPSRQISSPSVMSRSRALRTVRPL